VAAASRLKALWLAWFSQPKCDRPLFRAVAKRRPAKIMLMGLGNGQRALRLISLANRFHSADQVEFIGIDRFDSRPTDVPHFSLKQAHCLLRATGVKVKLIPGDPREALVRAANSLQGVQLVIISADQDPASLAQAWFYLPRTLAAECLVLQEEISGDETELKPLPRLDLERLATAATTRRRAA
jgi:hypothetical protein